MSEKGSPHPRRQLAVRKRPETGVLSRFSLAPNLVSAQPQPSHFPAENVQEPTWPSRHFPIATVKGAIMKETRRVVKVLALLLFAVALASPMWLSASDAASDKDAASKKDAATNKDAAANKA